MSFPRYPAYKDSGVEWLGQVPGHWDVLPIKRVVSIPITDGPHETPQFVVDGVPFVSAEAVSSGRIDFSKIRACITAEDNARYSLKYSPKLHDIYMVKSGATTGITAIVEDRTDFNIWSPLAVIRCGDDAEPHFVLNFMRSQNFLEAVTLNWSFGTQQNIGMGVIENLFCTLPPLPEQTQIAAFLDRETAKIDALVAEQRRLMALLREKRQAVISHAVTRGLNPHAPMKPSGIEWLGDVPEHWEVGPVKRFFASHNPRRVPLSGEERSGRSGDFPYYGASGVIDTIDEFIFDEDMVLVSEDGANLVNRSTPIAFVATGKYWVNNHAHILKPVDDNLIFWAERMEMIDLTPFITGSAQPKLTSEALNALMISVPPTSAERLAIQNHIAGETAKFDTLTTEAQRAIDLLQERRTALISATVTGQIDVRGAAKSL